MPSSYTVYLGKIPSDTQEQDIKKFFKNYGKLLDIIIKKGYSFVEFEDRRKAEEACDDLNSRDFLGNRCVVQLAKGSNRTKNRSPPRSDYCPSTASHTRIRPYNTENRVVVDNLSTRTTWRELKDYFRRVGEVTFADAHRYQERQGIVDFARRSEMRSAVKRLDNTDLDGRRIRVTCQKRSRSRSRSPVRL
ncbi:serine-arginine protein 55-like [Bolinopsis microptera]|uniref:serine-arginine protein 55-like n=1 Tax=Bolinopsis microptera TaxID=2820187 RepID=UPI003079762B